MIVALLFGCLFLLIALGLPIALSIGLPAIGFILMPGVFPASISVSALGQTTIQLLFAGVDSFDLLAVPLFMLAGSIMEIGGISRQLIDFSESLVGLGAGRARLRRRWWPPCSSPASPGRPRPTRPPSAPSPSRP